MAFGLDSAIELASAGVLMAPQCGTATWTGVFRARRTNRHPDRSRAAVHACGLHRRRSRLEPVDPTWRSLFASGADRRFAGNANHDSIGATQDRDCNAARQPRHAGRCRRECHLRLAVARRSCRPVGRPRATRRVVGRRRNLACDRRFRRQESARSLERRGLL